MITLICVAFLVVTIILYHFVKRIICNIPVKYIYFKSNINEPNISRIKSKELMNHVYSYAFTEDKLKTVIHKIYSEHRAKRAANTIKDIEVRLTTEFENWVF